MGHGVCGDSQLPSCGCFSWGQLESSFLCLFSAFSGHLGVTVGHKLLVRLISGQWWTVPCTLSGSHMQLRLSLSGLCCPRAVWTPCLEAAQKWDRFNSLGGSPHGWGGSHEYTLSPALSQFYMVPQQAPEGPETPGRHSRKQLTSPPCLSHIPHPVVSAVLVHFP